MRGKNILVIFFSLLVLVMVSGKKSGPFKSAFVNFISCPLNKTTQPMEDDPPLKIAIEISNGLARGNVSVLRDHTLKKVKIKGFLWESNKWNGKYQLTNQGCNRVFFPTFAAAAGVQYDAETCTFHKGVYKFKDLDYNKIQHTHMSTQVYGRWLWTIEGYSRAGTIFCHQIETIVEPEK